MYSTLNEKKPYVYNNIDDCKGHKKNIVQTNP